MSTELVRVRTFVAAIVDRLAHPLHAELPTIAEAQRMFLERPDLAAVTTEQGTLFRDGTLAFPRWKE